MPEETPQETPEDEVEAEMLRMMQEEVGGEGGDEGEVAQGGGAVEDALGALQETQGEEAPSGNIDNMLEQEMLRAMQDGSEDAGAAAITPYLAQTPALPEDAEGIERLSDIEVTVTVELGGAHVPIKDIMAWTRESTVELEADEHETVDVLVNGKLFAKGEVVVVGDNFGVRITELVDHPDEPSF